MTNNLPARPLGSLIVSFDRLREPVKESDRRPGPFPYYGASGVVDRVNRYIFDGTYLLVAEDGENLRTRQTPIAFIATGKFWVNNHAHVVQANTEADTRYLMYALSVADVAAYLTGSTMPKLTAGNLARIPIPFRPPHEQRAIASILGALDDKIELNRKMSTTLEAVARALFKSWFVDFDPVRAKAEGRDTGLPAEIANLFPDSFEDSPVGEVPAGWNCGSLGDVVLRRVERCDVSADTKNRPYVPIECISAKSLSLEFSQPGEAAQSSLTRFYEGDILFGAMRPYFHKVCIAPFDGTTRTTVFVLRPRRPSDFSFATLLLHDSETIDYATTHSNGTTIPYAVWTESMAEMPLAVPCVELRDAFDAIVRPILQRISTQYFHNGTLSELRDALLPKLISGELRASDVERIVEKSA